MKAIKYIIVAIGIFLVFILPIKLILWFIFDVIILQEYGDKLIELFPWSPFLIIAQMFFGMILIKIGYIFDS